MGGGERGRVWVCQPVCVEQREEMWFIRLQIISSFENVVVVVCEDLFDQKQQFAENQLTTRHNINILGTNHLSG